MLFVSSATWNTMIGGTASGSIAADFQR
jgi:hypothetical protein